ncbi:MAG: hypothetical protein H6575_16205 [Lewinellaceae bacterium]|nr:hypothetical protein [Lewinellaceae bacterium]
MDFKKIIPHLIAVGVLMLVAAVYFAPNAFNGKVLRQSDNDKARGMQTEIHEFMEKDGQAPLWTNSAFGGMPAYQIYSPVKGNLTQPVYKSLFLWSDYTSAWAQVFVAMLCMYLFLSVMKADWRVAIFGALAFGITSYNVDILEAGHSTKMAALALAPGVLAGVYLAFNGRLLLGGSLTALFLAMQLYANHVQITYYTLLISGIYFLVQFIDAFRHKAFMAWGRGLVACGLAILIGFACNLSRIWPTYEYSKETIRGKSELSSKSDKGDGLDKDYLFGWSYGIAESFTLIVPHFAGGGANESYKNTELYKTFIRKYSQQLPPQQADQQTAVLMYTGNQPFVGTAIYYGAIVCFLFVMGLFLVPGSLKWWLAGGGMFMVSLAWGKNFFLNDILYDYMPMFSKFRAVSMALGIGQLCFAVLAAMGLQKLADPDIAVDRKKRALMISAGFSVFWCLLAIAFAPGGGPRDEMLQQAPDLLAALKSDRASLVRSDAFRSIGFILAAAALMWFYLKGSLKAGLMVILVALLALVDHWLVCNRTLSSDNYEVKKEATAAPAAQPYDLQIKQDKDLLYRVLDYSRGKMTTNATASYFHKSLSGYHAAKLQRYQDMVDRYFGDVYPEDERYLPGILKMAGMFNVKYVIKPSGEVVPNPGALGNAWFVSGFRTVANADEEFEALGRLNFRDTAVIQQSYASALQGLNIQPDSNASIVLSNYHPDKMEYTYSAASDQLALFSEMYYPPDLGWKCFINGEPAADFIKADYLLRAMRLPAGQNMKLEMRFEPRSYYLGETISMIASGLLLLIFLGALFLWYRNTPASDPNRLADVSPETSKPASRTSAPPPKSGKKKKK